MLPLSSALLPLTEFGWRISPTTLQEYFYNAVAAEDEEISNVDLSKLVLHTDLHLISENFLKNDFKSMKNDKIVLQIDRIRNVALPKAKDIVDAVVPPSKNAIRLLKLVVSDGHSSIPAVEMSQIKNLNPDSPPGTKILLFPPKVEFEHGFLLLTDRNCRILGGEVKELIEKWRANEDTRGKQRGATSSGAPPWVPFGKNIDNYQLQKGFTAMSVANSESSAPPISEEFEQARNAVIARAAATGETKKFRNAPINVPQAEPVNNDQPKQFESNEFYRGGGGGYRRGGGGRPPRTFGRGRGRGGRR